MPAGRIQIRSSPHGLGDGRVDADGDPPEDAVRHALPQQHIIQDGVAGLRLLPEYAVGGVAGQGLRVAAVGARRLHERHQALVEEELADVADVAARQRVVGRVDHRVDVRQHVDVVGAARVVPREERLDLEDAVGVRDLDAAEGRVVDVGLVLDVAVVVGNNAAVDALEDL